MYAEWIKSKGNTLDKTTQIILDIVVPSFSVCALLGVTGWVTSDAIKVIITNGEGEDDVNVFFLYGFAAANFLVDFVSSYMFYAKRHTVFITNHFRTPSDEAIILDIEQIDEEEKTDPSSSRGATRNNDESKAVESTKSNLNMLSAFTHVGGDTLRTCAVFFAAVVSTASGAKGSVCDAYAAVVVTVTIIFCVIPLITEIYKASHAHFSDQ
jgi:Co/Zn/Cd efflux system component